MNPNRRIFPPPLPSQLLPPPTSIGFRPSGIPIPHQHCRLPQLSSQTTHQTYQPVFVIPISTASTSVDPIIVDLSKHTRPLSVPVIAPKPDNPTPSPLSVMKGKKSIPPPLDDREMRRRVKKQNMERRRRACISDKLTALHSLAVSLVGEKPQQQSNQRTEITDILNQCVNVLRGLSEFVKSEPELQAKMRRLGLNSTKESEDQRRRRRGLENEPSTSKEGVEVGEEEKENVPRVSAFTPVGRHQLYMTSTPRPVPTFQKRESLDSGLDDCITSPSFSSVPSQPSHANLSPSLKRPRHGLSDNIWRPYQD
ncbi:hypothetical protein Aperf_G00000099194 [Anoplocephala perfoliata]